MRALIVTGVNNPAERGDFMDRTLPIVLDRIPPHERRPLEDLKAELLAARPAIMGGLFSALSAAIRGRPALDRLPRLADWGRYAAGVYAALGWGVDRFLDDWATVEERQTAAVLEASPLAAEIRRFVGERGAYEGTASELHTALEDAANDKDTLRKNRAWPKTGQSLSRKLNEVVPTLELHGVKVARENRGKGKTARRVIVLSDVTAGRSAATTPAVCRDSAAIDPGLAQSNPADSAGSGERSGGSAASGAILAESSDAPLSRKRRDKDDACAVDAHLRT